VSPVLDLADAAAVGDDYFCGGGDEVLDWFVLLVVPGEADELGKRTFFLVTGKGKSLRESIVSKLAS
jgi:hypothetical protein